MEILARDKNVRNFEKLNILTSPDVIGMWEFKGKNHIISIVCHGIGNQLLYIIHPFYLYGTFWSLNYVTFRQAKEYLEWLIDVCLED